MNNKENYLVDFEMYKAFINQLKKENMYIKENLNDEDESIEKEIHAKRDDKLICSQILYKDKKPSKCYIFTDPNKEDTQPPKKIQRMELKTPAEVQAFINGMKAVGLL